MNHPPNCNCDPCLVRRMSAASAAERQAGWAAWYQRDAPMLRAFLEHRCRVLGCPEQGEDIVHDSFCKGFQNIAGGRYEDQGRPLRAYLLGIAKNLLCETRRRQHNVLLNAETALEQAEDSISLDDHVHLAEVRSLVSAAYARLPPVHRRVVDQLYNEEKPTGELAAELGKSIENTRAIACRAVHAIRQELERRHQMRLSSGAVRACLQTGYRRS